MTRRRLWTAAGLALAALLAAGLIQLAGRAHSGASTPPLKLTVAQMRARLAGSPQPLAALHTQANALLPGSRAALRTRLAALRGWPIVINKWTSWCQPCKAEVGAFQRVSLELGHRVAFIGIDSEDTPRTDPLGFLATSPLSYPSYYDPSGQLGTEATDSTFRPVTVIYDRAGGKYIHQGAYPSAAKLRHDIELYGLRT
jgi:cytochrome c biogenesis protein CcmG/thiol:disulfide interchange protein DsbE